MPNTPFTGMLPGDLAEVVAALAEWYPEVYYNPSDDEWENPDDVTPTWLISMNADSGGAVQIEVTYPPVGLTKQAFITRTRKDGSTYVVTRMSVMADWENSLPFEVAYRAWDITNGLSAEQFLGNVRTISGAAALASYYLQANKIEQDKLEASYLPGE